VGPYRESRLKSLVTSGHEGKLVLCFTHFDDLEGAANLPNVAARKNHLMASVDNAIATIGKSLGRSAENALKRVLPDRTVFVARIQQMIKPAARFTRNELEKLVAALAATGDTAITSDRHTALRRCEPYSLYPEGNSGV